LEESQQPKKVKKVRKSASREKKSSTKIKQHENNTTLSLSLSELFF